MLKAMYSPLWTLSLHVLKVVSLTLKPPQEIELPVNNSFFDLTGKPPNTSNASMFSSISVHPLSSPVPNQSNSRLSRVRYECDKNEFGQPPVESCREAYSWIGYGQEVLNYGDRSGPSPIGTVDVLLPLRYPSST